MNLSKGIAINKRNSVFLIIALNIVLFFCAIFVYFSQDRELVAASWIRNISPDIYMILKEFSAKFSGFSQVQWVRYYFADIVWAFNFSSIIALLWLGRIKTVYVVFLAVIAASSFELMQGFGVFRGAFDWLDLGFSILVGAITAIGIDKLLNENEEY